MAQVLAFNADKLVLVQSVSSSKKTFAMRRGAIDGISVGQTSLFSGESSSFKARCITVTRHYSQWQVSNRLVNVPFTRGQMVTYSNSIENMWNYLPKLFKDPKTRPFRKKEAWILSGSYSYALSETVSQVNADAMDSRTGLQLSVKYGRTFTPRFEWLAGLRFDRDVGLVKGSDINVVNLRYLGTFGVNYYLTKNIYAPYRFYTGLEVAYGRSQTNIADSTSTGTSSVLPQAKLGFVSKVNVKYSLIGELAVESINQSESFLDDNIQKTTITNTKMTLGIKF